MPWYLTKKHDILLKIHDDKIYMEMCCRKDKAQRTLGQIQYRFCNMISNATKISLSLSPSLLKKTILPKLNLLRSSQTLGIQHKTMTASQKPKVQPEKYQTQEKIKALNSKYWCYSSELCGTKHGHLAQTPYLTQGDRFCHECDTKLKP